MKLSSFRYIGPQCWKSMRNNGWMTFAAVLTIAIALFLGAFFWMLLKNIDANAVAVEDNVRVVAYLDYDVTTGELPLIEKEIAWIDGVADVAFVSKEEGILDLQARYKADDLVESLGGVNPLPDLYSITAADPEHVQAIAQAVALIDGVTEVKYGAGTVEKLFALTNTLRQVGLAIMGLLAVAGVVLIAMSTRLTIQTRKKEIMIMKWVGATNAFIRWPFFLEGLVLGLVGAALALALGLTLYGSAAEYLAMSLPFAKVLTLAEIWRQATLFTLGSGLVLGAVGSSIPLTRFLDV